jgi:protoporphyrinogen/coproporphyrinogen III oxidase
MKRVAVIGGGFSGLVTAYYLAKEGVPVTLLEKSERLGGLISTLDTPHGPVESAASGIRSSARLEELCSDLDLPLVGARKESRARYLFRDKPRQWPLGPLESARFAGRISSAALTGRFRPRPEETIDEWGKRVLGGPATHFIVGAALQGIYAGDPLRLSASLILGKKERPRRGARKGLVAPTVGMSQLNDALERKLTALDVEIRTGVAVDGAPEPPFIVCTAAHHAAEILRERAPETAAALGSIEMLPLLRITAFYPAGENSLGGFGVLFPRGEGVRALGVLFNTNIFSGRGAMHSESWIYGGAVDRDVVDLDDEQLREILGRDRERLYGRHVDPVASYPQRWPHALPHYDLHLESLLSSRFSLPDGVFLAGNYLNGIGLPMLLERGHRVASEVRSVLLKR